MNNSITGRGVGGNIYWREDTGVYPFIFRKNRAVGRVQAIIVMRRFMGWRKIKASKCRFRAAKLKKYI